MARRTLNGLDNIGVYSQRAEEFGLALRGGFHPVDEDSIPPLVTGQSARTLLLFGNVGSSMWQEFSESSEFKDEEPDPLNRWSERIGYAFAEEWGGAVFFPFGGPPYQPFLQWAKKAESLESSILGILMHPTYGLWHAYRFAIALPRKVILDKTTAQPPHACDSCDEKPCLGGCPVNAFDGSRYDVEGCYRYLKSTPDATCHRYGCQARMACPEGRDYVYKTDHASFHMEKFMLSQSERFKSDPSVIK